MRATAEEIPHPTKPNKTLWDATKDSGVLTGRHIDAEALAVYEETELQTAADSTGVGVLGSGSDFTVFVQRNGVSSHESLAMVFPMLIMIRQVASANGGFGSTLQDPVYHYHSVFDSQRWQELYGDPGFHRHVSCAMPPMSIVSVLCVRRWQLQSTSVCRHSV